MNLLMFWLFIIVALIKIIQGDLIAASICVLLAILFLRVKR